MRELRDLGRLLPEVVEVGRHRGQLICECRSAVGEVSHLVQERRNLALSLPQGLRMGMSHHAVSAS